VRPITELGADVVGTGFIGVVHVEALRRLGVHVHGVVGSSHERAAARSRELGLPPAYESFQAMLDDARVDVVHITSPNHLHHDQAMAALQAGKHVVCEKPLTTTTVATNVTGLALLGTCPGVSTRELTVQLTGSQTASSQHVTSTDVVTSDVTLRNQ